MIFNPVKKHTKANTFTKRSILCPVVEYGKDNHSSFSPSTQPSEGKFKSQTQDYCTIGLTGSGLIIYYD